MNKVLFNKTKLLIFLAFSVFFFACENNKKSDPRDTADTKYIKPGESSSTETKDATGGANISAVLAKMQGKWQYGVEKSRFLEVKGDRFLTSDGAGKILSDEKFEFHRKCPDTCMKNGVSGDTFCFTLSNSGGTSNCYLIRGLDGESMQYAAIENSENVTSFVRIK